MAFFARVAILCATVVVASAAPQYLAPPAFRAPLPLPHPIAYHASPVALAAPAPVAFHAPVAAPLPPPVAVLPKYAPLPAPSAAVPIHSQSFDIAPDSSYNFHYESADGSSRQETGQARAAPGSEAPGGVAVQGAFTYASPEGPIQIQYLADENGYQPSGPSVHPEIQKAVAEQVAFARSNPLPPAPIVRYAPAPLPVPAPIAYHAPAPVAIHAPAPFAYHAPAVAVAHPPAPLPVAYHAPTLSYKA